MKEMTTLAAFVADDWMGIGLSIRLAPGDEDGGVAITTQVHGVPDLAADEAANATLDILALAVSGLRLTHPELDFSVLTITEGN